MPFIELRVQLHDEAFDTHVEAERVGDDLARFLSKQAEVYAVTVKNSPQPKFKNGSAQ